MTWWGWLLCSGALAAASAVLQRRLRRRLVRRELDAGRVTVTVKGTTPGVDGDGPPRWRQHRVSRDDDGRLVVQRAGEHPSGRAVVLLSAAGSGRLLPGRERLQAGARHAVPVRTSAGTVELAAPAEVLAWLATQLPTGS